MTVRRVVRACIGMLFLAGPLKAGAQGAPWQNDALPVAQRVADLVGRMTLEEKVVADEGRRAGDRAARRSRVQLVERGAARRGARRARDGVSAGDRHWPRRGTTA